MSSHRNHRLGIVASVAFLVSSIFPVVAGLSHKTASFPKWWGTLDVGLAFVLAVLVLAVLVASHGKVTKRVEDVSYRAYRILIHGIFAMIVVFVLFGSRIGLEQLSNWLGVEGLVTLVRLACMGHNCYPARVLTRHRIGDAAFN